MITFTTTTLSCIFTILITSISSESFSQDYFSDSECTNYACEHYSKYDPLYIDTNEFHDKTEDKFRRIIRHYVYYQVLKKYFVTDDKPQNSGDKEYPLKRRHWSVNFRLDEDKVSLRFSKKFN